VLYFLRCAGRHFSRRTGYALVAQLDRAFGSDPEGQRFESSQAHQKSTLKSMISACFFHFIRILPQRDAVHPQRLFLSQVAAANPRIRPKDALIP
jgi:hypothetical protein